MPSSLASPPPALVFLHFLGGSAETWGPVERALPGWQCLRLDLPGFGKRAGSDGEAVGAMADAVMAAVAELGLGRWVLVGHSMGAKVALLTARWAEDGAPALAGLCGLVLVAGSPPAPEPMTDDKRAEMMGWFGGDAATSRAEADRFVRANVAAALDDATHAGAVGDVLRASVPAWRAWLTNGSREDLRDAVGVLHLPTLVLSGAQDAALGPDAQMRLMRPHLARVRFETIGDAAHLLPLEQPDRVAALIAAHGEMIAGAEPAAEGPTADRMTTRTRTALRRRGAADDPGYRPQALSPPLLTVLRAVLRRMLPQRDTQIDLAARIDAILAAGNGDGWRHATLPPDAEAYRAALRTLDHMAEAAHGQGFVAIDARAQEALLRATAAAAPSPAAMVIADGLDPPAMALWFSDLRADAVRLFMAHPATLAALRCEAPATGDDDSLTGYAPYRAVDAGAP